MRKMSILGAARLATGIFAKQAIYPAVVRFANADPNINSDFKSDVAVVRGGLTENGATGDGVSRQDLSMQNATTLPINDSPCIPGSDQGIDSIKTDCWPLVSALQRQVESGNNPRFG